MISNPEDADNPILPAADLESDLDRHIGTAAYDLGMQQENPGRSEIVAGKGFKWIKDLFDDQSNEVLDEMRKEPSPDLQGRTKRRNINLDHINDDRNKQLTELINHANRGFQDIPERQVQTHAETISRSQAAPSHAEITQLLGKAPDKRWTPEQIVRQHQMMQSSGDDLMAMADDLNAKLDAGQELSTEELVDFQQKQATFEAQMMVASGAAAEAGRLLNAFQAISKAGGGRMYYKEMNDKLSQAGGARTVEERIRAMAQAEDLDGVAAATKQTFGERAANFIIAARYNLMLSSIRTHAANIAGSTASGLYELAQSGGANAVNNIEYWVRKGIPGIKPMPEAERMFMSEIPQEFVGIVKGARDGLKLAGEIRRGEAVGQGKVAKEMGLPYDQTRVPSSNLGKIATQPSRLLEAEDAFFRSTYYNQKLHALVHRYAKGHGLGDAEYRKLLQNPPEEIQFEARQYAEKLTFTNEPDMYSGVLANLSKQAVNLQRSSRVVQAVMPFVRTPANLLQYSLEAGGAQVLNNPFKAYDQGGRNAFRVMFSGTPAERAEAVSRLGVAAGMWTLVADMYQNDQITGAGPNNFGKRRALEGLGWRANSVKIGDSWVEMNRLDPLGLTMGVMATGIDAWHSAPDDETRDMVAAVTLLTSFRLLQDRSYLSGLSDVFSIIDKGSIKGMQQMASSVAVSHVLPNIFRDAREMQDEYRRDLSFEGTPMGTFTRFQKQIYNAIPGLSDDLPPAVDWSGSYIKNGGNMYVRGLVPVRLSEAKQDPASAVLAYNHVSIPKPQSVIAIPNTPIKVNLLAMDDGKGWIYHEYQKRVGQERRKSVERFMKSSAFKKMRDSEMMGDKSEMQKALKTAIADGRDKARAEFFGEFLAGRSQYKPMVDGEQVTDTVELTRTYTREEAKELARLVRMPRGERTKRDELKLKEYTKDRVYQIPKAEPKVGGIEMPNF